MSSMTLFVDASWCPVTKEAGVGAWCIKHGWLQGSTLGMRLGKCKDSTRAELLGIAKTCEFIKSHNEFINVSYLMIQSDSLYSLCAMIKYGKFGAAPVKGKRDCDPMEKIKTVPSGLKDLAERIHLATVDCQTKVVRHVRGHENSRTSRSWVNERCDTLAKKYMREGRFEARNGDRLGNTGLRLFEQSGKVESGERRVAT